MSQEHRPYNLTHLIALFEDEEQLLRTLAPLHEIRADGIYANLEAKSLLKRAPVFEISFKGAGGVETYATQALLLQPDGDVSRPALPEAFTESDFMRFLTVRPDIAEELECRFTNDKPEGADDAAPYPLDEDAFREAEMAARPLAELLRRRLRLGGDWAAGHGDECVPPLPASCAPAAAESVPTVADKPTPSLPSWKMLVQAEATEHWIRVLATGAQPSVHSIANSDERSR